MPLMPWDFWRDGSCNVSIFWTQVEDMSKSTNTAMPCGTVAREHSYSSALHGTLQLGAETPQARNTITMRELCGKSVLSTATASSSNSTLPDLPTIPDIFSTTRKLDFKSNFNSNNCKFSYSAYNNECDLLWWL